MLAIIEELITELSLFLGQFCEKHHLSKCFLNSSFIFPSHFRNKQSTVSEPPSVNCELKSSDKQQFDIRLSFNSPHLKNWWTKLQLFCVQLQCYNFNSCLISKVILVESTHSVDIFLIRTTVIEHLLSHIQTAPMAGPKIVLIKLNYANSNCMIEGNYYFCRRINSVCSIIEKLLNCNCINGSVVGFDSFEQFMAKFTVTQEELQSTMHTLGLTSKYLNYNYMNLVILYFNFLEQCNNTILASK